MKLGWTKSLRFQLSAVSLAATALILLAASVLCFSLVRFTLVRETDRALQEAAASALGHMVPDEPAEAGDLPADPAAIIRTLPLKSAALPGADALCLRLARAETGRTAAVSPALAGRPALAAVLAALPPQPHAPMFAGVQDDAQVRCLTVAVPRFPYVLQVAAPWDPADDLLTELMLGLLLASLLFLLLSGIGSGLLVGRALRPIERIVSEAEQIAPGDLSAALSPHTLSDTEIGHLIAALNRMLASVSGAAAAQRQFTADASHEMRTPLTILRGQFELALSRPRSAAEYQRTVESGLEETLRMSRIVDSLAYLARGEAASPAAQSVQVSLAALAAEAAGSQSARAAGKGVRLVIEAAAGTFVRGDGDALRRLIQNLVENAVAYTPPGGSVAVSVSEDAHRCRLRVADTGIGIAPKDLPFVFDRFFRADPARVHTGGSGLGLSIVRSIAEAHGGSVCAESEIGQGSVFTVTLPSAA